MSILVLKLPDVKRKTEERPKRCPYCNGETFQLKFTVIDPGTSRMVAQINPAKNKDWSDALSMEKTGEDVNVSFNWEVPADLPIGTSLSGRLKGTIILPHAKPGGTFMNTITEPDWPVKIQVVTKDEIVKKEREFFLLFKNIALVATPIDDLTQG